MTITALPQPTAAPTLALLPDPNPEDARDQLRAECVEQLMRMATTDDTVLGLLESVALPVASAVVGDILADLARPLVPGCPLLAYGAGRELDHAWRRWYPPMPDSLYEDLLFHRTLLGADPAHPTADFPDAYAELEELRDRVGLHAGFTPAFRAG